MCKGATLCTTLCTANAAATAALAPPALRTLAKLTSANPSTGGSSASSSSSASKASKLAERKPAAHTLSARNAALPRRSARREYKKERKCHHNAQFAPNYQAKMMGSPFYYDVFFDDNTSQDLVFHDCMWSGRCTCSILVTSSALPISSTDTINNNNTTNNNNNNSNNNTNNTINNNINNSSLSTANNSINTHTLNSLNNLHHNHHLLHHHHASLTSSTACAYPQATTTATNTSKNIEHLDHLHHLHHHHSSTIHDTRTSNSVDEFISTSPETESPSPSPSATITTTTQLLPNRPVRRREHNDSERRRRDHLRDAFNFLRDQIPKFNLSGKKPPRIQILHEARQYILNVQKESLTLECRERELRQKYDYLITKK